MKILVCMKQVPQKDAPLKLQRLEAPRAIGECGLERSGIGDREALFLELGYLDDHRYDSV